MTRDGEEAWLRQEVIDTACAMSAEGLSPGTSGNVSARWRNGMLITPTGMPYAGLIPEDIVFVDESGASEGPRKPSSEWRFHLAAYDARKDAGAIVHAHSRYATALACDRKPIPAFHYMVAVAGGSDIPLAGYATFGSTELADEVARALKDRKACLMANHGQIAWGTDLGNALALACEVETLAAQYVAALQIGAPHILSGEDMADVLRKFESYGQQAD
jgi:L-fuculose-phosphate aldolase